MLKLDEKLVTALIALGISATYAFLVVSVVSLLIPSPSYEYYDPFFETQEECEEAGAIWLEDEYGEYCETYALLEDYYQKYDVAAEIYLIIAGALIILVGLVSVLVSLFLIKNKTVAYGFLGGGIALVVGSALFLSSYNPITLTIAMAISLAALVFIALGRAGKTN